MTRKTYAKYRKDYNSRRALAGRIRWLRKTWPRDRRAAVQTARTGHEQS